MKIERKPVPYVGNSESKPVRSITNIELINFGRSDRDLHIPYDGDIIEFPFESTDILACQQHECNEFILMLVKVNDELTWISMDSLCVETKSLPERALDLGYKRNWSHGDRLQRMLGKSFMVQYRDAEDDEFICYPRCDEWADNHNAFGFRRKKLPFLIEIQQ